MESALLQLRLNSSFHLEKTQPRKLVPENLPVFLLTQQTLQHSRSSSRGYWEARFQPFSWFLLSHMSVLSEVRPKGAKLEPWRTVPYFQPLRTQSESQLASGLTTKKTQSRDNVCLLRSHCQWRLKFGDEMNIWPHDHVGFPFFYSTTISQLNQLAGKKGWLVHPYVLLLYLLKH